MGSRPRVRNSQRRLLSHLSRTINQFQIKGLKGIKNKIRKAMTWIDRQTVIIATLMETITLRKNKIRGPFLNRLKIKPKSRRFRSIRTKTCKRLTNKSTKDNKENI